MKQKYYLRGLGVGILITTIVFMLVGPSELSEADIIQRAEQLGYVKAEETTKPTINLGELLNKEKEDAQTSGTGITMTPIPMETMAIQETITPEITLTPEETIAPTQTITEEQEITEKPTKEPTPKPTATKKPKKEPTATESPTITPTVKPTVTKSPTATPTIKPTITESLVATPAADITITPEPTKKEVVTATIKIKSGSTATAVCKQLEKAGIIEDANEMVQYLWSTNLARRINVGTYKLSSDMSLKEIADMITIK